MFTQRKPDRCFVNIFRTSYFDDSFRFYNKRVAADTDAFHSYRYTQNTIHIHTIHWYLPTTTTTLNANRVYYLIVIIIIYYYCYGVTHTHTRTHAHNA